MLGPMINPSKPQNQMVGVYSLELARIYTYLYQQSKTNFVILHSIDGYDEISLTADFKLISRDFEIILKPESLGLAKTNADELGSGNTVQESTDMFVNILEGKGTKAQNDVVLANSAVAMKCLKPETSFEDLVAEARESLTSGKALKALKKLIEMQK